MKRKLRALHQVDALKGVDLASAGIVDSRRNGVGPERGPHRALRQPVSLRPPPRKIADQVGH